MPHRAALDVLPLSRPQLRALARAAFRQLAWGQRESGSELRRWRARAARIPNPHLRGDALDALARKRTHADGAALLATLPSRRDPSLLRLLVTYEAILDFLDNVSERHREVANGRELHMALVDAVEPERPVADYYRHHPAGDDDGYLTALVEACRRRCGRLPSYPRVRDWLGPEARRMRVLTLNHISDARARDAALRSWADREGASRHGLYWFELTGAASASLVVLALLALAAEDDVSELDVAATQRAYWPWVSLVAVMFDSYADQEEDRVSGEHSYVAHYGCQELLVRRLSWALARAAIETRSLPRGHRHTVVVGCMAAMYLSKDSARTTTMADPTRRLGRAGGSLTESLLPVLRLWRTAYSLRSA